MVLATSNVVGGLVFDDTVNGVLTSRGMPYGWIEVRDDSGSYVTSVGTTNQGRFALRLEDGDYTLIGYPNWQFSQRPPIRLPITVLGDAVTDGLTGGELLLDLDSVPPNVTLTIDGVPGARLVAVEVETSNGWEPVSQYNVVSSGSSTNLAKFALPVGRYRLSVVPEIDYVITGANSALVEVMSPSGQYSATVSIAENSIVP
jgi:membrane-associated protease RseP (regulator of RpoE activity)